MWRMVRCRLFAGFHGNNQIGYWFLSPFNRWQLRDGNCIFEPFMRRRNRIKHVSLSSYHQSVLSWPYFALIRIQIGQSPSYCNSSAMIQARHKESTTQEIFAMFYYGTIKEVPLYQYRVRLNKIFWLFLSVCVCVSLSNTFTQTSNMRLLQNN